MFLWWGFKYWHMLHWFLILGILVCAWARTLPCVLWLIESMASFGEEHSTDLVGNYPPLSLLIKQWFHYYYLFVVSDRWQGRSLLYCTRCSVGHGRSPWMVNICSSHSNKHLSFCTGPGSILSSSFKCKVFLSPFAPHKAEGRRILEMEVISKTVVQVDICGHPTLKLCIRTQHEQGPCRWLWLRLWSQIHVPKAQKHMHVLGALHECGVTLCLWTLGSFSLAAPSTCTGEHPAWRKMRMKEDFFPTFENFKEIIPNLVLMIHVSGRACTKVGNLHTDRK